VPVGLLIRHFKDEPLAQHMRGAGQRFQRDGRVVGVEQAV